MNSSLNLKTAPTSYPVTVDEVKLHSRVTQNAEDSLLMTLISAATERVEAITGRALITQTWVEYFDCFSTEILLRKAPVQSITSIKYIDNADTEQTLSTANYDTDVVSEPARIAPAFGKSWPSDVKSTFSPVYVEYVAGYGDNESLTPDAIRWALFMLISHLYENREATTDLKLIELPLGIDNLLYGSKLWWMR